VRRIALIAATLAVLSGCGGEAKKKDTFTAREWAARAEAVCKRATDAIAERGWPQDVEELRSLASDAADDARAAIDEIDRLPVPADRADDVRAFVTGLRDLEPKVDELIVAATAMDLSGLQWAAATLGGDLPTLRIAAADAGLRTCLRGKQLHRVRDAIRAPVAAEQLTQIDLRLSRASPRAVGAAAELAAAGLLGPSWVEEDIHDYGDALEKLAAAPPSNPARLRARVRRLKRFENRIQRRMRAIPVTGQVAGEES
jgi:hypothetical protein